MAKRKTRPRSPKTGHYRRIIAGVARLWFLRRRSADWATHRGTGKCNDPPRHRSVLAELYNPARPGMAIGIATRSFVRRSLIATQGTVRWWGAIFCNADHRLRRRDLSRRLFSLPSPRAVAACGGGAPKMKAPRWPEGAARPLPVRGKIGGRPKAARPVIMPPMAVRRFPVRCCPR